MARWWQEFAANREQNVHPDPATLRPRARRRPHRSSPTTPRAWPRGPRIEPRLERNIVTTHSRTPRRWRFLAASVVVADGGGVRRDRRLRRRRRVPRRRATTPRACCGGRPTSPPLPRSSIPRPARLQDPSVALGQLLFDSLLHKQADGSLVPSLATGATVVDPQTIKVELRPGVKFQDKTPLDAEAVKSTLLRNRDAEQRRVPRPDQEREHGRRRQPDLADDPPRFARWPVPSTRSWAASPRCRSRRPRWRRTTPTPSRTRSVPGRSW